VTNYDQTPTKEILRVEIENRLDLSEDLFKECLNTIDSLEEEDHEMQWLLDTTEKWCKERAVYLALMESIQIADGQDKQRDRGAIPQILSEALSVCFDNTIGHDYLEDSDARYEFYHRVEDKIPFDIDYLNKVTKGGIPRKTLNIFLAGTGVGKSLAMCHCASANLLDGKNVLYITMEMAEEKIAERIDANLLNVGVRDLGDLTHSIFDKKVVQLSQKTQGRLIIKEYPTASAHVNHFESLLDDLAIKKNFKPDIVYVDYLNICASSRYKNNIVNSYTYIKSIAEELRGMACKYGVPVVSATQTTRSGYGSTDLDLTDTSESFGLPATADLMLALISTEELEELGQIMVKQLKNRYNDPTVNRKFVLGIDRNKMRLYDCDQSEGGDLLDSGQEEAPVKTFKDKFATLNYD
jgi:KaiC/GvpD/RAD55 family RecA-like ATPase